MNPMTVNESTKLSIVHGHSESENKWGKSDCIHEMWVEATESRYSRISFSFWANNAMSIVASRKEFMSSSTSMELPVQSRLLFPGAQSAYSQIHCSHGILNVSNGCSTSSNVVIWFILNRTDPHSPIAVHLQEQVWWMGGGSREGRGCCCRGCHCMCSGTYCLALTYYAKWQLTSHFPTRWYAEFDCMTQLLTVGAHCGMRRKTRRISSREWCVHGSCGVSKVIGAVCSLHLVEVMQCHETTACGLTRLEPP